MAIKMFCHLLTSAHSQGVSAMVSFVELIRIRKRKKKDTKALFQVFEFEYIPRIRASNEDHCKKKNINICVHIVGRRRRMMFISG